MRAKIFLIAASIFLLAAQVMAQGNPPGAAPTIPYQPPMTKPSYDCENAPKIQKSRQDLAEYRKCTHCDSDGMQTQCRERCEVQIRIKQIPIGTGLNLCKNVGLAEFDQCWQKATIDRDRRLCINAFETKYWN